VVKSGPSFDTHHRWALPTEFALDLVQFGPDGRSHTGSGASMADYHAYGQPVLAAADGRVVKAVLGRARVAMQIDVGFGDVVTPAAETITYPAMLEFPAPELSGYPRETVGRWAYHLGFGACVSETARAALQQELPRVQCDGALACRADDAYAADNGGNIETRFTGHTKAVTCRALPGRAPAVAPGEGIAGNCAYAHVSREVAGPERCARQRRQRGRPDGHPRRGSGSDGFYVDPVSRAGIPRIPSERRAEHRARRRRSRSPLQRGELQIGDVSALCQRDTLTATIPEADTAAEMSSCARRPYADT
jgi:hypothetical protein